MRAWGCGVEARSPSGCSTIGSLRVMAHDMAADVEWVLVSHGWMPLWQKRHTACRYFVRQQQQLLHRLINLAGGYRDCVCVPRIYVKRRGELADEGDVAPLSGAGSVHVVSFKIHPCGGLIWPTPENAPLSQQPTAALVQYLHVAIMAPSLGAMCNCV